MPVSMKVVEMSTPDCASERQAVAIVLAAIAWISVKLYVFQEEFYFAVDTFVIFMLCCGIAALLSTCDPQIYSTGNVYRANAAAGVQCCLLLPLGYFISIVSSTEPNNNDQTITVSKLFLIGSLITSLLVVCYAAWNGEKHFSFGLASFLLTIALFIFYSMLIRRLQSLPICLILISLFVQTYLHVQIPRWLPMSFTLGESVVIVQSTMVFILSTGRNLILQFSSCYHHEPVNKLANNSMEVAMQPVEAILFVQTAGVSCLLVVAGLHYFSALRSTVGWYVLIPGITAGFSWPVTHVVLKYDFVTWVTLYVLKDRVHIYLFLYWLICIFTMWAIVYWNARQHQVMHISTSVRKQFHLVAVALWIPSLAVDVENLYMAASCAVIVLVQLEIIRILDVPPLGSIIRKYFHVFLDERDKGTIILTHIYLFVGCSVPMWLWTRSWEHADGHIALYSGILSVGIGDTAASIFGSKFGKHFWEGTHKTIEGSTAAILFQLVAVLLLHNIGGICVSSWLNILFAVVMTSLLEAFTTQIDNLILPLFMFLLLIT